MRIEKPYLLFLGDAPDQLAAKTAAGVAYWRPDDCVGQLRLPGCQADLGLSDLTLAAAAECGVRTLIVGVANRGGRFSPQWIDILTQALEAGFDLASGLHNRLGDVAVLASTAERLGRQLIDVRHPAVELDVGNGKKRSGKRLLT
ncbi:MAG: DUF1611 domain-containing protein, partial [Candidatus Competibacteraceae bacterium]|nr:DUF1611 domain-containing protein [Candidatus Competibacteraceae bacterium]